MIFTPEHIDKIIRGEKTQTRRVAKMDEIAAWNRPCFIADTHTFAIVSECQKIIDGTGFIGEPRGPLSVYSIMTSGGRVKCQIGKDYAVQEGRGLRGVQTEPFYGWFTPQSEFDGWGWDTGEGIHFEYSDCSALRILITDIRLERLQDITNDDAVAEGCYDPHDYPHDRFAELWETINTRKGTRWEDNPLVWALTFEVVTHA